MYYSTMSTESKRITPGACLFIDPLVNFVFVDEASLRLNFVSTKSKTEPNFQLKNIYTIYQTKFFIHFLYYSNCKLLKLMVQLIAYII